MDNKVAKKKFWQKPVKNSILSGEAEKMFKDDPAYTKSKSIQTVKEQKITIRNPINHREASLTLSREGMTDNKVAVILGDKNSTKEQKETAVASWLFERGLESASFIADLFASKGQHTKETRAFKQQMRYDFEMFMNSMILFMDETSKAIQKALFVNNWKEFKEDYLKFCKEYAGQDVSIERYLAKVKSKVFGMKHENNPSFNALLEIALRMDLEGEMLMKGVQQTTEDRLREKGYGIYVDSTGQVYSIFDKELESVITKDKDKIKQDNGK